MCGNGVRCLGKYIHELQSNKNSLTIQTMHDSVTVTVDQDLVTVTMPKPFDIQWQQVLKIEDVLYNFHFLNTGVPHVVIFVEDLDANKWMELAPKIRFHPRFAPKGTNVNFAQIQGDEIRVRTYERGVEQETEACGTGATATALAAGFIYQVPSPIKVIPKSKTSLKIFFNHADKEILNIRMAGPATKIFHGEFILD